MAMDLCHQGHLLMVVHNVPPGQLHLRPKSVKTRSLPHPPSGKKHRKRKHEAYEALATTMTSLAKEVSSLAVNQQWMMQQLTGRPAAPGEHSAGVSSSHWPAPRGATDDCEGISLIASDNLEDDYIGNRAATSPHPSDLGSDQSSSSHSVPSDASAALSDDEFIGLMCRAARRIKVEMPATTQAPPSRFDRARDATSTPSSLPVLPDFVREMTSVWQHPEAATPPMRQWAQFANINGADEVGFGAYPAMDDSIAALVLPPTALVGKDPSCPNKQCRTTEKWLRRTFYSTAFGARLMNTTSVLALYQMELIEDLSAAPAQEVVKELRKVSEVLVHLARGAAHSSGRSIASLWMARRHLWLAQSKLPEPDRNTLMKLPLSPGFTFGPGAVEMLRRAKESRESKKQWDQLLPRPPPAKRPRPGWGHASAHANGNSVPFSKSRPNAREHVQKHPAHSSAAVRHRPGTFTKPRQRGGYNPRNARPAAPPHSS